MNWAQRVFISIIAIAISITLFASYWNFQLMEQGLNAKELYAIEILRGQKTMGWDMTPEEFARLDELIEKETEWRFRPLLTMNSNMLAAPTRAVLLGLVLPLALIGSAGLVLLASKSRK